MAFAIQVDVEKVSGRSGPVAIVRVGGQLDASNSLQFQDQLHQNIGNDSRNLILDMGKVSYISSVGIGILIGLMNEAKSRGGQMLLINLQEEVQRVLRIVGFLKMAKVHENEKAAREFLGVK